MGERYIYTQRNILIPTILAMDRKKRGCLKLIAITTAMDYASYIENLMKLTIFHQRKTNQNPELCLI